MSDFSRVLPFATVYVYDNNSTDNTKACAVQAGAIVRSVTIQGKGAVVRRMFADIDADIYVLVDGDDTYDASALPRLVDSVLTEGCDLLNAARQPISERAFRRGHSLGNRLLSRSVGWIFGRGMEDILSGYKVLSRRFVKSFPVFSRGFEIEVELSIHALALAMPFRELFVAYSDRPVGSASKLRTVKDGVKIAIAIVQLMRQERPSTFYTVIWATLSVVAIILSYPLFVTYFQTGMVPRLPTALLSTGLEIVGFLSLTAGLILDTVTRGRRESKVLAYLSYPSVWEIQDVGEKAAHR